LGARRPALPNFFLIQLSYTSAFTPSSSSYVLPRNFSFFLLTFCFCIHQRAEIRSDDKWENFKTVTEVAAIIEGSVMNLSVETKVAIAVATSFIVLMVGAMAQG